MQRRLLPAVTAAQQLLELFVNQETGNAGWSSLVLRRFGSRTGRRRLGSPGWCQRWWTGVLAAPRAWTAAVAPELSAGLG